MRQPGMEKVFDMEVNSTVTSMAPGTLGLVGGRHHHEAGQGRKIGRVEGAGMGRPVGADEARGAAHVVHEMPALIGQHHLHEHVAREDLALDGLFTGIGDLLDRLHRDVDFLDQILHFAVFRRL